MADDGSHDDAYHRVLEEFGKLHQQWQWHRESINGAIGLLADEVFKLEKRLDKDDAQRIGRQKELDTRLKRIERWQHWRLLAEIGFLLLLAAALIGKFWL